jgi:membrane-associated protease RseP (regulator of RpoE activity)
MSRFSTTKNAMFTALAGSMILGFYPVRAQNPSLIQDKLIKANENQTSTLQEQGLERLQPLRSAEIPRYYELLAATGLKSSADDLLGANLQPVGETLRAQLDIPEGQGLVIEGLRAEGACAQAGLQQNDVLLFLADKSLRTTDDLIKCLKASGDSPVPLKIRRAGKPVTIQVRPIYRVTLGPVGEQRNEHYLGISVVAPNDATRAQLGLTDGNGMVINEIEKGSPADKAGIKKYDIVLQLNDKRIDSPEALQRQVQAAQDHPANLKILRAGKPIMIPVLAATRKVDVSPTLGGNELLLYLNRDSPLRMIYDLPSIGQSGLTYQLGQNLVQNGQPADAGDLRQRLDHLEKELTAVRAALDKINETLKANKRSKGD